MKKRTMIKKILEEGGKRDKDEGKNFFFKIVVKRGTIHGIKYLMDDDLYFLERIFWAAVIAFAFVGACLHLRSILLTYEDDILRTTILNTYYKYANIPFPSVTVCDSSRMDWHRLIHHAELEDFIQVAENITATERLKLASDLKNLLAALSVSQFGSPKDLNHVKNAYGFRIFDDLLINQLLLESARPCEKVFDGKCWWKDKYFNCCEIFEVQKTGYGYCYSFNSDISEKSKIMSIRQGYEWRDWNNHTRPRRTNGHGLWTGLRFAVNMQDIPSYLHLQSGIVVIIGDPAGFPYENDVSIMRGKFGSIGVWGDSICATARLRTLPPLRRSCLFPKEKRILHREYLRQNCIANCYRIFVQSNCNCSLDFIYFQIKPVNVSKKYPPCKTKQLKCLAEYNYAFNNHLSEETIQYDKSEKSRYFCQCPDDCESQKYIVKASTQNLEKNQNQVVCDVHYERSFGTLYQTDISFDSMDALVSYGGIVTLFLGASVMSLIDMAYFIVRRLHSLYSSRQHIKAIMRPKENVNVNALVLYRNEFPKLYHP